MLDSHLLPLTTGSVSLLAASLALTGCSLLNVQSGPGLPVGPSFRTASHVASLIATDMPHPPRLQPNQVQVIPRKFGLLLTPLDGSPPAAPIEIARNVMPTVGLNQPRLLAVAGDRVWIQADGIFVYDLRTRRLSRGVNPPPAGREDGISSVAAPGWRPSETRWLGLHLPSDVTEGKLKPGSFFMPGRFPLRTLPYEPYREGQIPKREQRRLYAGLIDATGPIPRIASMQPIGDDQYSNGVFLAEPDGSQGALIAYEGRFPNLSLHLRRVDAEGKALWTVDTRLTRDLQILPGRDPLVLRGAPLAKDGKFPQPFLVLLNTRTGQISECELRW